MRHLFVLCSFLSACSHAPQVTETAVPVAKTADLGHEPDDVETSDAKNSFGLKTVYFPYDSNIIVGESQEALEKDAAILRKHVRLRIQIEGHCDARGSIQYNLALGERRARAVRAYLIEQGISADRLSSISYGKERPAVPGDSEEVYSKNRRANIVVLAD